MFMTQCKYFGKHGCQQFIQGKPIVLSSKFGVGNYIRLRVWFDLYQREKGQEEKSSLGLGGAIV